MKLVLFIIAVSAAFFSACDYFEQTDDRLPIEFSEVFDTTITIAAVGDMMLARGVQRHIDTTGYDRPLSNVAGYLNSFDVATGNLESPISDLGARLDKMYAFRANPPIMPELVRAGFDVLTVANNHSFDYGLVCFTDCLERLSHAGIFPVGGGKNLDEALQPAFITVKGKRLGWLAFNDTGTNYIGRDRPACAPAYHEWVFAAIAETRPLCDILFVHIHWGEEYYQYPTDRQIELGRAMIDSGVDVVLGHHPHYWEGVEFYNGGLIAYSMGNFVFDQYDYMNNLTGILELSFRGDSLISVAITPVEMLDHRAEPHIVRGELAGVFAGYIDEASRMFSTDVELRDDKIHLTSIR